MGSKDCNTELSIGFVGHSYRPRPDTFSDRGLVLFGQCIGPLCSNDVGELNNISPNNCTISSFHLESNLNSPERSHLKAGDVEVEKTPSSSRLTDEEEDGGCGTRKKLRLSQQQSVVLEESFRINSTLNPREKQNLATQLDLLPRQVEVWFQNRRARTKLKQTEYDCELLRKRCVYLTEENRKLNKELEELKALKFSSGIPFYMKMNGRKSVSMCPSCQRVMTPDNNTRAFGAFPNLQLFPSR